VLILSINSDRWAETRLINNTLIVPDDNHFIVFCPHSSKVASVDTDPLKDGEMYEYLHGSGFFGALPQSVGRDTEWSGFYGLTLFMTRDCNLRCVYCYASAGEADRKEVRMSKELAESAVRHYVDSLPESQPMLRVSFHGGGEPTLNLTAIKHAIKVANEVRGNRRLRPLITTNGFMSQSTLDWIMCNEFAISISADGPPHIQDKNRPAKGGGCSSKRVESSIKALVREEYPFTIRVTFSSETSLREVVDYFGSIGVKSLHLEPLFPYGREYSTVSFEGSINEVSPPIGKKLSNSFLSALDAARDWGIVINNSHLASFTSGSGYFCGGVRGRAMMVTHDGILTTCLEVVDGSDAEMPVFRVGSWIPSERRFQVDLEAIQKLQERHVESLNGCVDCFARYVCSGGCFVKAFRATGTIHSPDISYCQFTKEIVPEMVKRIYRETLGIGGETNG